MKKQYGINKSDIDSLKQCILNEMSVAEIYDYFGGKYTKEAIRHKAKSLGFKTNKWTDEEVAVLMNGEGMTYKQLHAILPHKSIDCIQAKCSSLGINYKITNPSFKWSEEEIAVLKKAYPSSSKEELTQLFPNKSYVSICAQARRLGVYRDTTAIYDGIKFDSIEEMSVYKYLKQNGLNVIKCPRSFRLYNDKHDEYYIPDFIIDDNIIIEYFGLYKPKEVSLTIVKEYVDKSDRKSEFYSSLSNYRFVGIYPEDDLNEVLGRIGGDKCA